MLLTLKNLKKSLLIVENIAKSLYIDFIKAGCQIFLYLEIEINN
jgi:hypothetical protein